MPIEVVFETHELSEDNERGIATGELPGRLSAVGRCNAAEIGRRRRGDGITAVFTSDQRRAAETARTTPPTRCRASAAGRAWARPGGGRRRIISTG
jgi:broad specificity phosphatase PhoE